MAQSPRSTALRLDLQPGTDPIRGCVEHPDGHRQPFWGWLELIEALQGLETAKRLADEVSNTASSSQPSRAADHDDGRATKSRQHIPEPLTEETG